MEIFFYKMHGLGNDFIIIDYYHPVNEKNFAIEALVLSKEKISHICNRRIGIGCDQLILLSPHTLYHRKMVIYNSDGSLAEACGNASRCVIKLLANYQNNGNNSLNDNCEKITIEVNDRSISGKYYADTDLVTVNLGNFSYCPLEIGIAEDGISKLSKLKSKYGYELIYFSSHELLPATFIKHFASDDSGCYCISIGNPHIVIFVKNLEDIDIKLGQVIENNDYFKNRINVSFVYIENRSTIKVRTWERGAGETSACGTAACASYIIAYHLNLIEKNSIVCLPGGNLVVELNDDATIELNGSATLSFIGIYTKDISKSYGFKDSNTKA